MKYTYSDILRRLKDVPRKGWAEHQVRDLIDTLWREEFINRTSGFDLAGGPDSSLSFDPGTRILKIEPVNKRFAFWQFIFRIAYFKRMEPEEIEIPDQEGLYLVYLYRDDDDPSLRKQKLFFVKNPLPLEVEQVYINRVVVAWIYFVPADMENQATALYFGDSRHGSQWNPQMHWWQHRTLGSLRVRGLLLENLQVDRDGSVDAHATFGISGGSLFHDDVFLESAGMAAPATLPVFYMAGSGVVRYKIHPGFAIWTQPGRACFNAQGQLLAADSGNHVVYMVFRTNCLLHPFINVPGQRQYVTLGEARRRLEEEILQARERMPHSNMLLVGALIYQTSDAYQNQVKSRIVYSEKVHTALSVTGTGSQNDPIRLMNDEPDPAPGKFYGAHPQTGELGYHEIPLGQPAIIHQPGHGLQAGDVIRHNGILYVKACADNDTNAQACGIVSVRIDQDSFSFIADGIIPGSWIPGEEYFLSPAIPGQLITLSDPEVWEIGQVRLSCGWGTTLGLKVEIDVGDVISEFEFPTAELKGYWDREFEFCINPGLPETFDVDLWAVYEYDIVEAILESDGTLHGVSISINGQPVGGLGDITVGPIAKTEATSSNTVTEGNRVTISTTASFGGAPGVIKGKLKILKS